MMPRKRDGSPPGQKPFTTPRSEHGLSSRDHVAPTITLFLHAIGDVPRKQGVEEGGQHRALRHPGFHSPPTAEAVAYAHALSSSLQVAAQKAQGVP